MWYLRKSLILWTVLLGSVCHAQNNDNQDSLQGESIVLNRDTLFFLYDQIGPFSPRERADAVADRLIRIARTDGFDASRFIAQRRGSFMDVLYGDTTVLSLTEMDARGRGQTLTQTADEYVIILRTAMNNYSAIVGPIYILKIVGSILLVMLVLWLIIWGINRLYKRIVEKAVSTRILAKDRLHLHKYKLITVQRQKGIILGLLRTTRVLFIVFVVYLALPVIFSVAPLAEDVAHDLIGYVTYPLKKGFWGLVGYLPKLIGIIVIVLVVRFGMRILKSLAHEIANGKVELKGFYPDWAIPTYNLLKFVIFIFTFVLIFPLLPGSQSAVFQGVSVFLGLLISLGSQSAISNIISGLVITYMRAFNIGDRVRIGETTGDVIERSLLVTKVRTIKNEDVTIPNSKILSNHTVNYTSAQAEEGLILHTTVTIGYDVPWRKVKALLVEAALHTGQIEKQPEPFVLQTSLDDFYVSYQLNAYTKQVGRASLIYSELHSNIQDIFAREKVEIMSPHYRVNRETLNSTIPEDMGQASSDAGADEDE